jgi:hypothetical protein
MCDADGAGASALIFQNEKKKGARNGKKIKESFIY